MLKQTQFFRILYFVSVAVQVYRTAFWMRKYGSVSFKRTHIWSTSEASHLLDLGALTSKDRKNTHTTTTTWVKNGRTKFTGNTALKGTQSFGYEWQIVFVIYVV
jgi:hypothetical protein